MGEDRGTSGRGRFRDSRWRSNGEGLRPAVAGDVDRAEAEGEGESRAARRRRRRAAERAAGGMRRSAILAVVRKARAASRDSAAEMPGQRVTVGTTGFPAARASRRRFSSARSRFFAGGVDLGDAGRSASKDTPAVERVAWPAASTSACHPGCAALGVSQTEHAISSAENSAVQAAQRNIATATSGGGATDGGGGRGEVNGGGGAAASVGAMKPAGGAG